jgi:hypothetical protein
MSDPTTEYPRPPFAKQQQDWPGLASKMNPRPDHGETSYKGSGRLAGRRALLTGGDSGMGRAAAIAFAREGADIAINYLPVEEPDAREVIELIRREGRKAVALPGDIRSEAFCEKLVADAVSQLGGLDILVNNAARQVAKPTILDISTEQFDATFKTNVYAMFWITKAALPHLRPGSAIINTASVNAYDPSADIIDYAATKGAIAIFTKALAKQVVRRRGRKRRPLASASPPPPCVQSRNAKFGAGSRDQAKRVVLDFAPVLSPDAAISMAPVPFSNSFARDTCSAVSQWTDNSVPPFLTWPS